MLLALAKAYYPIRKKIANPALTEQTPILHTPQALRFEHPSTS
jgi:hypothetical protein